MEKYKLTPAEIDALEKKGLSREEIALAEHLVSTYENWLDPNYKIDNFSRGIDFFYRLENGDYSPQKGEGVLTLSILPEIEWEKIVTRKSEIVEGFVVAYTNSLIGYFENQYFPSLERKKLVEGELSRVEKLLFEYNEDFTYRTFGDELWLSFYTYRQHKNGSMCYWYERFCTKKEDATGAVSRYHSALTASELNNNDPDPLHFIVAALAFNRFKKYLIERLEAEKPTALTFEDWRSGSEDWKNVDLLPSEQPIKQPFERYLSEFENGQFRYYSLSGEEYQKIAAARNAIFEKQTALFIKGQIDDFEQRFSKSKDIDSLKEMELQKVNQLLTDEKLSGGCAFPNPNGGAILLSDLEGIERKKGEKANLFVYWHNKLIVQGIDARPFIEPKHEKDWNLVYPIATHVLWQYKQFLESYATIVTKTSVNRPPSEMHISSKTLAIYCFYRESKGEYPELEGMNRKQIAEKIAHENNLSPNHFRQDLSAMKNKGTRLVRENISRIHQVLEMLTDFPKSLQYAQDELKILQIKNE